MKTLGLFLALALSCGLFAQDREIEFRDLTFDEAITAAEEENKPIFMDCYTVWCGPCKWMAANIFTNNEVADYYNENFVCVKFDMEKGEGLELAKEFKIRAYPTLLFINGDRKLVMKQIGAPRDPEPYIQLGKNARSEDYNLLALAENLDENRDDPSFMAKYFEVMAGADMVEQEEVDAYFAETPKKDWLKKENVKILTRIEHDIESKIFQDILKRSDEYIAVNSDIEKVIGYSVQRALMNQLFSKEENAEEDYETLLKKVKSWDFPGKNETLFMVESLPIRRKGPDEYIAFCLDRVKSDLWDNARQLNSVAWYFFEHTEDPAKLQNAEKWAARSVSLEASHHALDTYANLLFVNGQPEKALEMETRALKKAKAKGVDTASYEKLIAKIKDSM
ncbi:MAG: DUF255 domain-containing protein [Bacteroidetes bacterium]|jgi:thiol-disulfide isomerase/thioredoxin|nr:DUF255 domain-containing protein [Bacteroidota bacterium]